MKNFIINIVVCSLLLMLSSTMGLSQMEAFNYQGIAVDDNGAVISEGLVGLQFSIIQSDPNNAPQYVDSHSTTTTTIGHFTADIGKGAIVSGAFDGINWAAGPYYLKVELDANGGSDYTYSSIIELLSVPYAKVVANSANSPSGRVGPSGDQGAQGAVGFTGLTGPTGYSGGQIPGADGPQGDPGIQGSTGAQGPEGDPGAPNGLVGPIGDVGPKGSSLGDQGAEGPRGAQGIAGLAGLQGPKGDQGDTGPASTEVGPKGPVGPVGESGGGDGLPGPNGADGATGPQGAQGPQGVEGSMFFNTITSLSSGVPTPGPEVNIYIDSGANRADGQPGIRFYNGTEWIDL